MNQSSVRPLTNCTNLAALQEVEVKVLGRKGKLTSLLKSLKDLSPDERKSAGQEANKVKAKIQQALKAKRDELEDAQESATGASAFDATLPGTSLAKGSLHPITRTIYELNDAFHSIGFEIYEGPEITSELYSFDNLNFPPRSSCTRKHGYLLVKRVRREKGRRKVVLKASFDRWQCALHARAQATL